MEIREITGKNVWEGFLFGCPEKTFLQSWDWGDFQKTLGNRIWRLGVFDNGELLSVALVVKMIAKRGTFLLIQHGPVVKITNYQLPITNEITNYKFQILKTLSDKLKMICAQEKASFVRIAPLWEKNEQNEKTFKDLGFIDAPMHANAYTATWKLDILLPEDQLLAQMRKTTRYLIRQAENNPEISVEKRTDEGALGPYQELNLELAKRQNFAPFSSEFIQKEFEALAPGGQIQLFLGKYQGEVLAGALVIFWSDSAFYHQAASSQKGAKIPLPYLILWEAIKEAKTRGCRTFDFWGFVDPKSQPRHPWAGPTLFKMGFGGQAHEYLKTKDLPLSKKYWLVFLFEKIRRARRGL